MFQTILTVFKSWFGWPDFKDIGAQFSQPLQNRLDKLERKIWFMVLASNAITICGFIAILACLEDGFHWRYLVKF